MRKVLLALAVWALPMAAMASGVSVTLSTATPQHSRSAHVVATFSEGVTGFSDASVTLSPNDLVLQNFSQDSTTTYSFDVMPSGGNPDATLFVAAEVATSTASSTLDNDDSNTLAFSFYTEHPHVSVSAAASTSQQALPSYTGAPFTAYATWGTGFAITDFATSGILVTNGSVSNLQSVSADGTEFSFLVTPTAEGATTTVGVAAGASSLGAGSIASDNTLTTTYDATAPVLALVGSSSLSVELGSVYTEQGAAAADAIEGDLTGSIVTSGTVDTSTLGDYTVTYSVTDAAGNSASTTRAVSVVKKAQTITIGALGNKSTSDGPFDITATTTSGLDLTYGVAGNCSLATTTVTLAGAGSCTVTVSQSGDALYAAATSTSSFTISAPAASGGGGGGGGGGGSGSNGPVTPVPSGAAGVAAFGIHAIIPTVPDASSATQFSAPAPTNSGEVLGAQTYKFTTYLVRGSEGVAVTNLQKLLIALGFLAEGNAVGHYGPLTVAAVKAYQAAHDIAQTGTVGPLTRAVLNKETTTY